MVTADSFPEVTLSNNQLLLGWKAGSVLKAQCSEHRLRIL